LEEVDEEGEVIVDLYAERGSVNLLTRSCLLTRGATWGIASLEKAVRERGTHQHLATMSVRAPLLLQQHRRPTGRVKVGLDDRSSFVAGGSEGEGRGTEEGREVGWVGDEVDGEGGANAEVAVWEEKRQ
jgi:hypothetical protein